MSYTWSTGAAGVLEHIDDGWAGIWSLLFAAAKAAFRLSLQVPIDVGAELAYAAMDACEARDEVGWSHPEVPMTAIAVDLGPIGPVIDLPATCAVIVGLLDGALDRLTLLEDAGLDGDERQLARQVASKARAARRALTEIRR